MSGESSKRKVCNACGRAKVVCLCPWLVAVEHETPVVVLRHPNEARHALNTATLLGQMGSHCRVLDGETFARDDVVLPGHRACLLFPGEASVCVTELREGREKDPIQLIVPDGTWSKARHILRQNPWLNELPQLRVELGPSRYVLRKRAPEGGSTLEAVVAALRAFEDSPNAFEPMLSALDQMMQFQREAMGETRFQEDFGDRLF